VVGGFDTSDVVAYYLHSWKITCLLCAVANNGKRDSIATRSLKMYTISLSST
jgi:hypothetical protein